MLHLDPKAKGKYVKLGSHGWVKLSDIKKPKLINGELVIDKNAGGSYVYKGGMIDHVKAVLDKELGP